MLCALFLIGIPATLVQESIQVSKLEHNSEIFQSNKYQKFTQKLVIHSITIANNLQIKQQSTYGQLR